MQELEKILEEMREASVFAKNYDGSVAECVTIGAAERILRKHTKNDGWIPVEKEFPPNAKHEGAFCPKYQVMTKYGVTEGWYNPDAEGWYVLIWFMTDRYLESEIDFDKGDNPKIVFLPDEVNSERNILIAWKEMELYRPERRDDHDRE